jgi:hypothetical protein
MSLLRGPCFLGECDCVLRAVFPNVTALKAVFPGGEECDCVPKAVFPGGEECDCVPRVVFPGGKECDCSEGRVSWRGNVTVFRG